MEAVLLSQARYVNIPVALLDTAVQSGVTGTTSETALAELVIPAGVMGPHSTLRILPVWTWTNSANNKTIAVKIGSAIGSAEVIYSRTRTVNQSEAPLIELQNRGSLISQLNKYSVLASFATNASGAPSTNAVNFAQEQRIFVTGTLANSGETIVLQGLRIELIKGLQ